MFYGWQVPVSKRSPWQQYNMYSKVHIPPHHRCTKFTNLVPVICRHISHFVSKFCEYLIYVSKWRWISSQWNFASGRKFSLSCELLGGTNLIKNSQDKEKPALKGNCHELRMHLSKFVCGNMPGFQATFRSRNLLFCLQLSLSPPKARYMRAVLPCIDAALNQTWKDQAVFFKLTVHDSFPLRY